MISFQGANQVFIALFCHAMAYQALVAPKVLEAHPINLKACQVVSMH